MPFYGTQIAIIDIHKNNITGESIVELASTLQFYDFFTAGSEWQGTNIVDHSQRQRKLDLSFCEIREIPLDYSNAKNMTLTNLLLLFKFFYMKGDGNPFTCYCQIFSFLPLFEQSSTELDWTCMIPQELEGRLVTSITENEVYCPVNVIDCPKLCACFVKYDSSSLIVDCRNVNMSVLPERLPPNFRLELLLKNTSLLTLDNRDYLMNVSVLDISENKMTYISPLAAAKLQNMTYLNLENNDLTSLPVQLKYANISRISLSGNSFLCDCHTRWMRAWLHDRLCPVTDWNVVKCLDNEKQMRTFVTLPQSTFVCLKNEPPSIAEHVVFPSIVIGSCLFVITIISLIIYFQRLTVRVLIYMFFGVRLCDSVTENVDDYLHDGVIIYDKTDEHLVEINIKRRLQESNYRIADMYKDSVIGFPYIEGIKKLISRSRRVIFCITKTSLDCELITVLWNIVVEKAMKSKIKSIILIASSDIICTDENMKMYIRNGRYIKYESKLLYRSLEYLMPKKKQPSQNLIRNDSINSVDCAMDEISLRENRPHAYSIEVQEATDKTQHDIYLVYPDDVDELHQLARYEIIPFLQEKKQNARVLQDDFVFGEDIRQSIERKLDRVKHVIFIISNETLENDVALYVLTTIITKAFVRNSNYLLMFSYGQINVENMTENLKHYVNNYITASVNDFNFKERMLEALVCEESDGLPDDTESTVTEDDVDDASLI